MQKADRRTRAMPGAAATKQACGLRNAVFWSVFGNAAPKALGLLAAIIAGRLLGPTEYGAFAIVLGFITMLSTLGSMGGGVAVTRCVAQLKDQQPARVARVVTYAGRCCIVVALILATLVGLSASWISSELLGTSSLSKIVFLAGLVAVLSSLSSHQQAVLFGIQNFRGAAKVSSVSSIISFVAVCLGARAFGLAGALCGVASGALTSAVYGRLVVSRSMPSGKVAACNSVLEDVTYLVRPAIPVTLSAIIAASGTWVASVLLVQQPNGMPEMGVYQAVMKIRMVPELVAGMLISPMLPLLTAARSKNDEVGFGKVLEYSFLLGLAVVLPCVFIQLSCPWITRWVFGSAYAASPVLSGWMMWYLVGLGLVLPMSSVMISCNREWMTWALNFTFTILAVLLSAWLIPKFGVYGLAAAQTCAYFVANILCIWAMYKHHSELMKRSRWAMLAALSIIFAIACTAIGFSQGYALNAAAGLMFAAMFVALVYSRLKTLSTATDLQQNQEVKAAI